MRVLVSAYACEPDRGSEPGVGWNCVCQVAKLHEVWVITRANNRDPIESALAKEPLPNVHWVYFDLPGWMRFWKKGQRGLHPYYCLWQLGAYFVARKLHRKVGFDLIHHVTFVNYWMPTFLALLPIPFLWGPVGGGECAPHAFWRSFSLRGKVFELLRDLARTSGEFAPFVRLTAQRAAVGLATTEETAARLRALGCRKVRVHSEAGLPADEIVRLSGFPVRQSSPFRLMSVGHLFHWKGFELGLRAFALFKPRFPASEYWIIGDGPERKRLMRVAGELGVASSVRLWGAMPRWQVLEKLGECDVLVHPSLHDSGGWVCLEAMAAGRPAICLDLGGPARQVTEETGIKIPATSPGQAIADLAAAFEQLAANPDLRARLGEAARETVRQQFSWDHKGNDLRVLYETLTKASISGAPRAAAAQKGRAGLRVLVSAYACEPDRGSEPGVGWNCVCQVAKLHEVWVITRANNREPIEKALAKQPRPNVHWVYFDLPRWARFWKKSQRGLHPYYCLWQLGAYFVARKLHRKVGFNLLHHVTFVNYWMPTFLALLPIPFLWGPVGGGECAPHAFWRSFSLRGKVFELLRDLARTLGELNPFVRLTAQRAALGLATTEETAVRLRALGCRKVRVHSEAGLPADEIVRLSGFPVRQSNRFRLASIGNLTHLKGFELGLRAFARLKSTFPASEYWIIGDGPERKRLGKLARSLGLVGRVTLWGRIPRWQVLERLRECDVLVHPSLHDSGGWVCLEAMAAGRPVVCLHLGGPALQVTEETGIRVAAISPEQAVRDLAETFYKLASDPELRARLGSAARKRVEEHFDWDKKGLLIAELYKNLSIAEDGVAVEDRCFA